LSKGAFFFLISVQFYTVALVFTVSILCDIDQP